MDTDILKNKAKAAAAKLAELKLAGKHVEPQDLALFLDHSGLLFEINRQVLHPMGLALTVIEYGCGESEIGGLMVDRDPAGMYFGPESLEEGRTKSNQFLLDIGQGDRQVRRESSLGYVQQSLWETEAAPSEES